MLAYLATKATFLQDAPVIEDKVAAAVKSELGFSATKSEYESWRNSLGNAMANVMRSALIPDDASVAIEYRLNGRKFRLDFVVGGKNAQGTESLIIIELKQWTLVKPSELAEHVRTVLGGGEREVTHPSYQAWSYKSHLEQFNEYVYSTGVKVMACAYLHNCKEREVISSSIYEEALALAPVYFHGDYKLLQEMIGSVIATGTDIELMERVESSVVRPSKQLADAVGGMLQGQQEFVLIDEQKTVYETIIKKAKNSMTGTKQVLIIKGGPGTGKSVISINALATLTKDRLNTKYVTANAAPRDVFQAKLKNLLKGGLVKHLFGGSGSYTDVPNDSMDVLIVDEAHRLKMKSGMFKNLGEDQTNEIIKAARASVFFIDEEQKVTWSDAGEISRIKEHAARNRAEVTILELQSQFRCSGSDDYMAWLDDALGVRIDSENYFSTKRFDFQIFDSPSELHEVIRLRNLENNRSRMVAGYCWDWKSKTDSKQFDIVLPEFNFAAQWNLASYGNEWIINPQSVEEVGCIHTCQGLEVDYVGVIVGPDFRIAGGELITNPEGRARTDKSLNGYKKERKLNPLEAEAKADQIIRNTYRTLMSRGMKGCYVYFTDPEVANYFRSKVPD